jgi:small subunit ribosomal protein S9
MPKKEADNKKVAETSAKKETAKKVTSSKEGAEAPKAEAKSAPKVPAKAAPVRESADAKAVTDKAAGAPKAAPRRTEAREVAPAQVKAAQRPAGPNAPLGHGVGRRKSAVARVWLRRGKGSLVVNDKEHVHYFDTELSRAAAILPFHIYPQAARYDAVANVLGGGLPAQADAVKLGIARALVEINPEIRPLLREHGLLTVDSRVKERKKYGQKAARRKFQFVKR